MNKYLAIFVSVTITFFVSGCAAPKLAEVNSDAKTSPINSPEQIEIIKHRYEN